MSKRLIVWLLPIIGITIAVISIIKYSAVRDSNIYFFIAIGGTSVATSPIFMLKKWPSWMRIMFFLVFNTILGVLLFLMMYSMAWSSYNF